MLSSERLASFAKVSWLGCVSLQLSLGCTDKLFHQHHQVSNLGTLGFQSHLATPSYLFCILALDSESTFTHKIMSRDACCYRIKCADILGFVLRQGLTSLYLSGGLGIHECLCSAPAPGVLRLKVCTTMPHKTDF